MGKFSLGTFYPERLPYTYFFKITVIAIVQLLISIFYIHAESTNLQGVLITIRKSNTRLENILNEIEKQTNYLFIYKKNVDVKQNISVDIYKLPINEVLKKLFEDSNINYTIDGYYILLSIRKKTGVYENESLPENTKTKIISGSVKDKYGEPIAGANVVIKGSGQGTITDWEGKFNIIVYPGSVLNITYLGYKKKSITIYNQEIILVILDEESKALEEVVVIGYGSVKKSNLTSSIAKINSESLKERPVGTVGDALQGQLTGMRAQNISGLPGQDLQIQIRGINTINGSNDPLYVIDGVPRENMNDLNPHDVSTIQILKDASATSIYGARGANGVILIETKQGTGKPYVAFDAYYGFQNSEKFLSMMNKDEWLAYNIWYRNESYLRSGGSMKDPMSMRPADSQIPESWLDPSVRGTNWQDAIMRTAPIRNYQISASAKGDTGNIYFSAGYFDQQGIILDTYFNRLTFRLNVTVNISNRLRLSSIIAPTFSNQDYRNAQGKETPLHHALNMSPLADINSCTKETGFPAGIGQTYYNPVVRLQTTKDQTKKGKISSTVWGDYRIIDSLTFKTQYSYNYATENYDFFLPNNVNKDGDIAIGYANTKIQTDWSIQNTLTYDKDFSKHHSLNIMLGQSADEFNNYHILAEANNYPNDNLSTLNVATTATHVSTERNKRRSVSFFGRTNYTYKDRYIFNTSLRYDGSSRFGRNKKWGIFPSISTGWKLNEENFLRQTSWLSLLKIRFSWGIAGNDRIGNHEYFPLMDIFKTSMGGSIQTVAAPKNIENPSLQWESTRTTDIGVDVSVFNNRLQINFDYYINKTEHLLFNVPIPATTGFSDFRTNLGAIRNQGWEIDLTSYNLTGGIKWSTTLNISANKNKVLDMGDITEFTSQDWDARFITHVGGPVSQFLCYRTDGILTEADFESDRRTPKPGVAILEGQEPGNIRYIDQNQDGKITSDDMIPYGNNMPDLLFGIINRFTYKNTEMSILLQGQIGGSVCFLGQRHMDSGGNNINQFSRWLNCWKPDYETIYGPGENPIPTQFGIDMSWDGKTPYVFGNRFDNNSDFRIYDTSYLRIKNITFSYRIPPKILRKTTLRNVKLYMSIDNLITFNKYPGVTPETNSFGNSTTRAGVDYSTYPLTKKYTLGVNVAF